METTDAVAFTDMVDSDCRLHDLNNVREGIFKSPEDIDGAAQQHQGYRR
jgi:hypothetical protein